MTELVTVMTLLHSRILVGKIIHELCSSYFGEMRVQFPEKFL